MKPTDDEIRAAHRMTDELDRWAWKEHASRIRAALPQLPEPKPPKISKVSDFAGCSHVRARDAEIIAWAEARQAEVEKRNDPATITVALGRYNALQDLIQALRDAGKGE